MRKAATAVLRSVGRLEIYAEGEWWVAYYVGDHRYSPSEMARLHMRYVVENPERKRQFQELMRECVADSIERLIGRRPAAVGDMTL